MHDDAVDLMRLKRDRIDGEGRELTEDDGFEPAGEDAEPGNADDDGADSDPVELDAGFGFDTAMTRTQLSRHGDSASPALQQVW